MVTEQGRENNIRPPIPRIPGIGEISIRVITTYPFAGQLRILLFGKCDTFVVHVNANKINPDILICTIFINSKKVITSPATDLANRDRFVSSN